MNISLKDLKNDPAYSFLDTEEPMQRLGYITLGGSHAYGTNTQDSDVDIRGWYMEKPQEILGMEQVEGQYENKETDSVFYSFRKYIKLLMNCNPNVIETLGTNQEHVLYADRVANELRENYMWFLSKKAFVTFAGYATAQLRRLENDSYTQSEKERHILQSLEAEMLQAQSNFNRFDSMEMLAQNQSMFRDCLKAKYPSHTCEQCAGIPADIYNDITTKEVSDDVFIKYAPIIISTYALDNSFKLYIDDSTQEDMDAEIYVDANLTHVTLRDYLRINSNMSNMLRNYGKLNKRNHKKDAPHLFKHAMHLVRLYLTGVDILEKQQIVTYRSKEHDMLMTIRNGEMPFEKLFELQRKLECRLQKAKDNSKLPEQPNIQAINQFVINTLADTVVDMRRKECGL